MFVYRGKDERAEVIAAAFVAALAGMIRFLGKQRPPFIAAVTASGNVELREAL